MTLHSTDDQTKRKQEGHRNVLEQMEPIQVKKCIKFPSLKGIDNINLTQGRGRRR